MNWIDRTKEVPEDRRTVLAWGSTVVSSFSGKGHLLGETKFNPRSDSFDIERQGSVFVGYRVTHWAEIVGPEGQR